MRKFEFAIVVDRIDTSDDAFVDRFFEAGCADALVTQVKGTVVLQFTREAKNAAHAVASAIRDVQKAGARVKYIEPDSYVNISDIAERAGLTRQSVSLLVGGERGPGDSSPAQAARDLGLAAVGVARRGALAASQRQAARRRHASPRGTDARIEPAFETMGGEPPQRKSVEKILALA